MLYVGMAFSQTLATYTVNTFAGSAPLGDGGPAVSALLRWPASMVFDNAGNLYVADEGNASIRRITPDGTISTIAGTGTTGFSGDDGPAEQAQISSYVNGIALDSSGNLYISDAGNNRIRMVSHGVISTVVDGSTLPVPETGMGFNGIALDSQDSLYIVDGNYSQIFRIAQDGTFAVIAGNGTTGDTGDGGPATQAAFISPQSLYIDPAGAIYVIDSGANRIRKITPDGNINAFAGTGQAGYGGDGGPAANARLNSPSMMAPDAAGNLYLLDNSNYLVRRIGTDGVITKVAGSGSSLRSGDGLPATQAGFGGLQGLAVTPSGDLYIADFDSAIRVVPAATGIINTAYGQLHFTNDGAPAANALFNVPYSLTSDGQGNLYFGDWFRLRKIDSSGILTTIAGSVSTISGTVPSGNTGDGGPATAATINRPYAIAVDKSGNVYFSSIALVRRVDTNGIISTFAGGGASLGDGGPATKASFGGTSFGLAFDTAGALYISDTYGHRIRRVTPDGTISTFAGTGTAGTSGNGGPAASANINGPRGLAFDAAGNLYFADFAANRVRKISPDGTIKAFAGNGTAGGSGDEGPATSAELYSPWGVAVDSAGNVYIAEWLGARVRVVTPDGIIHSIASGNPVDLLSNGSFSGDGGPAIGADYCNLGSIVVGSTGKIYVLDTFNERIRILTPNQ